MKFFIIQFSPPSGSSTPLLNSDVRHPHCVLYNSKELSVVIRSQTTVLPLLLQ